MKSNKMALAKMLTTNLLNTVKEETKCWEADGKDAWAAIRRLGSDNLPDGDEVIVARRLFKELQALKVRLKKDGIGFGAFALEAGLGSAGEYSKELYRMMLAPGKDPGKVRLRKSATKYRQLITAIGKRTKESTSSLANRLLMGTSLHPSETKDWDEVEQVQVALQTIVDSVDSEYGLYSTFIETAEMKAAHAKTGGDLRWPHYDREYRASLGGSEDPAVNYQQELNSATDVRYAFWESPVAVKRSEFCWWGLASGSGCLQDDSFFYVPHTYLGFVEIFNIPDRDKDPAGLAQALVVHQAELVKSNEKSAEKHRDDWDADSQSPVGQTTSFADTWGQWHAWLVIYPTPDNQRLMPMLYVPQEEGGSFLLPLDAGNLNILRKAYSIESDEIMTVFDRIKSLIGHIPGTRPVILDGFRRTAPWLRLNPFFKMKAVKCSEQELLNDFCRQLWQKTSTSERGHA